MKWEVRDENDRVDVDVVPVCGKWWKKKMTARRRAVEACAFSLASHFPPSSACRSYRRSTERSASFTTARMYTLKYAFCVSGLIHSRSIQNMI